MATRETRYSQVSRIIYYLQDASIGGRTNGEIVFAVRLSYPQVRKLMEVEYPHCFRKVDDIGWFITGEPPVAGIPFNFHPEPVAAVQSHHDAVPSPQRTTQDRSGGSGWTYNQAALRYLDSLFPGKTFREVVESAYHNQTTDELATIGKTITHAANEIKKTGAVTF